MYFEFNCEGSAQLLGQLDITPGDGKQAGNGIRANIGNTPLKEIECEIGGQKIDKHYGHWLATWSQLTEMNPTGSTTGIHPTNPTDTEYRPACMRPY